MVIDLPSVIALGR